MPVIANWNRVLNGIGEWLNQQSTLRAEPF